MKNLTLIAILIIAMLSIAAAQVTTPDGRGALVKERPAQPVQRSADDADADATDKSLETLNFITGTWQGEMNNGEFIEETWSAARGGSMMGMFRWLNAKGQVRMYEMLTISHEEDETFLRLRHFSSKLIAWEEKDAPLVLRLTYARPGRAIFTNVNKEDRMKRIIFNQPERGKLEIDVDFGEDREALEFRFDRAE